MRSDAHNEMLKKKKDFEKAKERFKKAKENLDNIENTIEEYRQSSTYYNTI